jgi:AP-3 complex subunit mu
MGPGNSVSSILPSGSLSQVPWRRQGVKKATNEIYVDINEEIDGIIEAYAPSLVMSSSFVT